MVVVQPTIKNQGFFQECCQASSSDNEMNKGMLVAISLRRLLFSTYSVAPRTE